MSLATFVGGPLDGQRLSSEEVNSRGRVLPTPAGGQVLIVATAGADSALYERVRTAAGVEYRHVGADQFWESLTPPPPKELTAEERQTGALLDARATEFEEALRAVPLGPSDEVAVLFHSVDRAGVPQPPVRYAITPLVTVKHEGAAEDPELWRSLAGTIFRDGIIGNINSTVRHAPPGWLAWAHAPTTPVRITDVELLIERAPEEEDAA